MTWLYNFFVTLSAWAYFTIGFVCLHAPAYLVALIHHDGQARFQRYNRRFFQNFFSLLAALCPATSWNVDERVSAIENAVVLCNHQSYLDPLLLISLLPRSITVVKPVFFSVPIFAALLRKTGYFPATASGRYGCLTLAALETLPGFFAAGGSLFIFPEGTRNRAGDGLKPLQEGALKLALHTARPIAVLGLSGTGQLFPPGKFLFNAKAENRISLKLLTTIEAGACGNASELRARLEMIFTQRA
ncbi:MAG: 1-acyl-sn-glycerol-3-phosphate acyltransferase [Desulfobulbaceae bacterium]|nr:1-acyl-sn-glycerol-3-phosphate acyltransferase [Desulfobulbaceae bacterium]